MFMTFEELVELTGWRMPGKQLDWLKARHWVFETNARGWPKVLRKYAEARLGAATARKAASETVTVPRLDV
jgi:hypothetical protein